MFCMQFVMSVLKLLVFVDNATNVDLYNAYIFVCFVCCCLFVYCLCVCCLCVCVACVCVACVCVVVWYRYLDTSLHMHRHCAHL